MRRLTSILLAAAVVGPAAAMAAELPDHRWSVRANFGIHTPSDPLPGDALLAVSLGRALGTRFGVEAFLGSGLPVDTLAKDGGGGQREVDLSSGLHGAALLKVHHKLSESGRTRVSLGAGPSFISGDVFGTVPMARAEAGLDWRFAKAAVFSLTIGYESVLSTSRTPFAAADCYHEAPCPPHYKAGAGQVTSRWGLGFTF